MAAISTAVTILALALVSCSANDRENSQGTVTSNSDESQSIVSEAADKANIVKDVSVSLDENDTDTSCPEDATKIEFDRDASVSGTGAQASGSTVTVTDEGAYVISGNTDDGQIIVDADGKTVHLILNGADISSAESAPIYVKNADKAVITLASGTTNTLTDSVDALYADAEAEEPNAAVFSKDDLTINGDGKLIINANFNNGINSKDDLYIVGGDIEVNAANNGIKGKDCVYIAADSVTVKTSEGDAIQSYNSSDGEKGFVLIERGDISLDSAENAVQAETTLAVRGGKLDIKSGNNGLKSKFYVDISGDSADINIDSANDGVKAGSDDGSDGYISVSEGTLTVKAGDDGIHADCFIGISGGCVDITDSYEGIESKVIDISGGDIRVRSEDDGINVSDGSSSSFGTGRPNERNADTSDGSMVLTISGGSIYINAEGDGLDSNGSIVQTGGKVYVDGPTNNGNGALDYNSSYTKSGGTLIAAGSSGMMQAISDSSQNYCLAVGLDSAAEGGTTVRLTDSSGKEIVSYTPSKSFSSLVISTDELEKGETYSVYVGESEIESAELTEVVTYIGAKASAFGGGMGGRPGDKMNGEMPRKEKPNGAMADGEIPGINDDPAAGAQLRS